MKITGLPINLKFNSIKPWSLLDDLEKIFLKLGKPAISPLAQLDKNIRIDGDVWIEDGVRILPFTVINGPAFFGKNCVIGPHAFVRPFSIIGDGSRIGHCTEIKASIIGRSSFASHFAYIGDSIIGSNVNLGAGVKLANLRFDKKKIAVIMPNGNNVNSGRKKLGAIICDYVQLGVNAVIMPGTVVI
jgi:bifunctional UDP-N-acetylglucosamine pyrophosphorylase/glucosamine-1-phosphate N-acetyltransferase